MPHCLDARGAPGNVSLSLCCALLVLLTGCRPCATDTGPDRYLNWLGIASPFAPRIAAFDGIGSPPVAAALQPNSSHSNIDEIDFLTLRGCKVQATVGKYRTQLAREAKPSQRLLLELEYLRLAPPCIARLRDDNKITLANHLDEAWRQAHDQLPALIFEATLGSDEYRSLWRAVRPPGDYPRVSRSVATSALDAITRQAHHWLSGDYEADNRDFEVSLSEVAGGDAALLLQDHIRQRHCPTRTGRTNSGEPIFLTAITGLETQLTTVLPPPYARWIKERTQHLQVAARTNNGSRESTQHCQCAPWSANQRHAQRPENWLH